MGKMISKIFLGALAVGLMFFTGSRTLDLLAWALPVNQQIYQWLGLCAFEGGMLFWSFYFINGAKGTPQRSVSVLMAVFSIVAVGVATVGDLNIDAAQQGKIAQLPPTIGQALVIFLGVVIFLNVAAYMACHLLSIENLRRMKEQEAEDKIYEAGLRAITALAPSIAADAAPYLAEEWSNRTWQNIVPGVRHETRYLGSAQQPRQNIDTSRDAVTSRPGKVAKFLGKIFPSGEKSKPAPRPGRQETIDSNVESEENARLYRDAQRARRAAPSRQQHHARQAPARFIKEVEVPSGPLATGVQVKKGSGPYKVNKKPMPPLKLND